MIRFDDHELSVLTRFAAVLHPQDRSKFLVRVAALLTGQEIGPGSLHRACERAQAELRAPSAAAADVLDGTDDGSSSLAPERGRKLNGGKYA